MYVRPVGKAFRVCVFEIYGFVLGSGQPRTDARLWVLAEIRLSGPNSVNAFVVRSPKANCQIVFHLEALGQLSEYKL